MSSNYSDIMRGIIHCLNEVDASSPEVKGYVYLGEIRERPLFYSKAHMLFWKENHRVNPAFISEVLKSSNDRKAEPIFGCYNSWLDTCRYLIDSCLKPSDIAKITRELKKQTCPIDDKRYGILCRAFKLAHNTSTNQYYKMELACCVHAFYLTLYGELYDKDKTIDDYSEPVKHFLRKHNTYSKTHGWSNKVTPKKWAEFVRTASNNHISTDILKKCDNTSWFFQIVGFCSRFVEITEKEFNVQKEDPFPSLYKKGEEDSLQVNDEYLVKGFGEVIEYDSQDTQFLKYLADWQDETVDIDKEHKMLSAYYHFVYDEKGNGSGVKDLKINFGILRNTSAAPEKREQAKKFILDKMYKDKKFLSKTNFDFLDNYKNSKFDPNSTFVPKNNGSYKNNNKKIVTLKQPEF